MEIENKELKTKNTLTSVIIVLTLTIGTKLLGLWREALMGRSFGTGLESDAYYMAQKITTVIMMSIGLAITVSVVPIVAKHYTKGESEEANKFVNKVLTFFSALALVFIAIILIFAKEYTMIIANGFTDDRLGLTVDLVRILFPSTIFIFGAYVLRAVLQAKENFWGYSIMSVPFNVLIISFLYFGVERYGIYGLTIATLIAWGLQFFILLPFTNKEKVKYKIDINILDNQDIKEFFIILFPILISTMVYSVNTLIDSSFASNLEEGQVAALNYGYLIYSSIAQTFIYSISAVLFPKLVGNYNLKKFNEFKEDTKNIINNIFYLMIPAMFGFIVLSRPFVEFLFKGGRFNIESADWTQGAFIFYSIGLVGFALQEIISKTFFAVKDTKTPTIIAILSVVLNVILNTILIKILGMKGLALATSIAITFNAVVMYIVFQIKYGKWDNLNVVINFIKISIASIIMYFLVDYLLVNLNKIIAINSDFVYNLISIVIAGSFGVLAYAIMTYILKVKLTHEIIGKVLGKIFKNV